MKKVKQSFTLVEILVVIVIIGILSSFIFFTVNDSVEKANLAKTKMFEEAIRNNLLMNLVSEWKFDGDAKDSWGSNNGILNNFSADSWKLESECISGKCLEFDGSNDYIAFNTTNTLGYQDSEEYTVSLWSNWISTLGSSDNHRQYLWDNRGVSGDGYYAIVVDNENSTNSGIKAIFSGTAEIAAIAPLPIFNEWIHVVASFSRNSGVDGLSKIYLNGVLRGEDSGDPGIKNNRGGFIGRFAGGGYLFNGLIDEVKIYDAIISESQIKQEYLAGLNNLYAKGLITQLEYDEKLSEL